ncbi:MAG: MFS transporter, partial [Armatimonadota bacterium]|nr:MFS transporter [Armatimonadota bacterium]
MAATDTDAPKQTSTVQLWAALIIAFLGWMFDGMEMGLYSWAMPQALRDLMGLGPAEIGRPLGITVALFLSGMSLGGVVFGRLGDHIGRTKTLVVTVLMYATFTGLSGFCQNFGQLAACRFLGAMGLGGEWGLGVALVMESWPNASRPLLAGLLGAAANVGFLIAGGITMLLARYGEPWRAALGIGQDGQVWRLALVAGFLPAVLTFVIRLFVKEPQRWVQSRQRGERASFAELLAPALRRQTLMGVLVSAVAVLGMWGVYQAWLQAWVSDLVTRSPELQGAAAAVITEATAKA